MDVNEKLDLIKRNTTEILGLNELQDSLKKNKKLSSYYGIAPTGPVHIAYFVPLTKLFDFEKAGIKNTILIADIHAALDDLKTPWDRIKLLGDYYEKCIELSFPWDKKPKFVRGSSFELTSKYMNDVLKLSTVTTISRATRAASEVTRMKDPKVSELIYPIMQALDEQYLNVDIQLGGIDQRHIFAFARDYLPKIGYKPRIEIMTPLIVSLKGPGVKMSASVSETSIKVYDSEKQIKDKINNSYCPTGDVNNNPVTQLIKHIVFPIKSKLTIERESKFGGDITFDSYEKFETEYKSSKLHPQDVKNALSNNLISIFSKVRNYFEKNKDILKKLGENFI